MSGRISTHKAGDRTVHSLHDDATGASASILPSYGFNLFDLRLPLGGEIRPIVVTEPGWEANPSRPARHGFPILFPFAGRIRDARYSYRGKHYELVANKPPHAIHGFAYDAAWDVLDHSAGKDGATILGRFQISKNALSSLMRWPADAILEVRYTLMGSGLTMTADIRNPSETPLPWVLGIHSYFALPFDRREDLSQTRIVIPAESAWALEDTLPTGEIVPVSGTALDYRKGRSMAGLEADIAVTGLEYENGTTGSCRMIDEKLGANLRMTFDRKVREIIVFTPSGSPGVIAVEPYTGMADPFELLSRGAAPGLAELASGASSRIEVAFEAFSESEATRVGTQFAHGGKIV